VLVLAILVIGLFTLIATSVLDQAAVPTGRH
jgi:hypothetical protein